MRFSWWELRPGVRMQHQERFTALKEAAQRKKKTTITAESFDSRAAHKLGRFFDEVFLPVMKTFASSRLSYDEVKRVVMIPALWGRDQWRSVQGAGGRLLQGARGRPAVAPVT
jgi:hypothetical protein